MSVDLIFSLMAKTVISSQTLCLAAAQNMILVEIGMAENIVINNVSLSQLADASLSCASNVEIDVPSMQESIARTLKTLLNNTKVPDDVDRVTAIQKISTSFTQENVGACIASAKNIYKVIIERVGGTFTWENFTLEQQALAQLEECSMSFTVGTKNMKLFVQEDLLRLTPPPPCDKVATNTHILIGGALGGVVAILAIATLAVGLSTIKKKQ
jgi:hypothetical protein